MDIRYSYKKIKSSANVFLNSQIAVDLYISFLSVFWLAQIDHKVGSMILEFIDAALYMAYQIMMMMIIITVKIIYY